MWDVPSVAGGTSLTIDPRGSTVNKPILRFANFGAGQVTEVSLGGVVLQPGSGYFATVDAATHTLWLTLNGAVSSALTLRVR